MMSFNTVGQENPLGPRAPLSWQDVQTQAEKYQAAIHHPVTAADERWCTDMEKVSWRAEAKHISERIVGKRMRPARSVESVATWHLFVRTTLARTRRAKVTVRATERRVNAGEKAAKPETCLCGGKEGHKKADCSRNRATCSSCGNNVDLRAVGRNPTAHEASDEPAPEAVVGESVVFGCL